MLTPCFQHPASKQALNRTCSLPECSGGLMPKLESEPGLCDKQTPFCVQMQMRRQEDQTGENHYCRCW